VDPSRPVGLADTFVAVVASAWGGSVRDPDALDATLARIIEQAHRKWPGVLVAPDVFAEHVAERTPDEADPLDALADMHVVDLYLACACSTGDPAAIAHFESKIMPAVGPAVARIDPDPEVGREIAEEVRVRLLVDGENGPARIRSYIGRGPLTSWVQVTAMRLAYSHKRKKRVEVPDADRLAALPVGGSDAEMDRIRAEFAGPFKAAFSAALGSLSPRERNVLRLHLLEGLNTETIGRMYRVHRATVARWIARSHETVLRETRKALAREGIGRDDFDSFMRLVRSQLEVSIVSALS
jgi:RNA polymerase sigma-70 factor (ECF subfamily)